jgi:hypothetical protein
MRIINKALCASTLAASLAGFISTQAVAQNAGVQFRVVAGDRNPSGCQQFDAALSRVHTFTAAGDAATLTTAGGVTSNMKQTTPGVFTSTLGIGGTSTSSPIRRSRRKPWTSPNRGSAAAGMPSRHSRTLPFSR